MFDQLSVRRARSMDSREALLAFLSFFFHASGVAALLAGSWLTLTPIQLPRLRPYLVAPVIFPAAGTPAPRLGGGGSSSPARATPPSEREAEATQSNLSQPDTVSIAAAETPASSGAPAEPDPADAPAGPGSAAGVPEGAADGRPGGICVGDGCDPRGVAGSGPGLGGGIPDASEIHLPGIHQVTEPVIIESSRSLPRYPELARRAGVEGQVILQAVIDPDGSVDSLVVLRESPPRVGFGESAREAVSRWRYRPGTLHGKSVTVQMTVTVVFSLSH